MDGSPVATMKGQGKAGSVDRIDTLNQRLRQSPEKVGVALRLVQLLTEAGRVTEAHALLHDLSARCPRNPVVKKRLQELDIAGGEQPPADDPAADVSAVAEVAPVPVQPGPEAPEPPAQVAERQAEVPAPQVARPIETMPLAAPQDFAPLPAAAPEPVYAEPHFAEAGIFAPGSLDLGSIAQTVSLTHADIVASGFDLPDAPDRTLELSPRPWRLRAEVAVSLGIVIAAGAFAILSARSPFHDMVFAHRSWVTLPRALPDTPVVSTVASTAISRPVPAGDIPDSNGTAGALAVLLPAVHIPAAVPSPAPPAIPSPAQPDTSVIADPAAVTPADVSVVYRNNDENSARLAESVAEQLRQGGVAVNARAAWVRRPRVPEISYYFAEDEPSVAAVTERLGTTLGNTLGPLQPRRRTPGPGVAPGTIVITLR